MSEFMAGGRRRVDRVLAPDYLVGLSEMGLDEIRRRRAEAEQEEVDLSYARRLLQGRLDILRAEREGRAAGTGGSRAPRTDAEIVEALARILADGPRTDHGMGRYLGKVEPTRVGEHRREAERAAADVASSDPGGMSDLALAEAVDHLRDLERRVSRTRRSVQVVVDTLTEEIARRYATGEIPVVAG
ncbi:MAG TPA: aerial mycelium formation protein [Kineosporiaceae bacterium]